MTLAFSNADFSGMTVEPLSLAIVRVDRPFYFLIRDKATGIWLFFGRVVDPAA